MVKTEVKDVGYGGYIKRRRQCLGKYPCFMNAYYDINLYSRAGICMELQNNKSKQNPLIFTLLHLAYSVDVLIQW